MERTIRQLLLPTVAIAFALLVPAQASASSLAVLRDCADSDSFERNHSRGDLLKARSEIQADLAEYGTCGQMIQAELASLKKDGPGGSGGAGGGPSADLDGDGVVTPKERKIAAKRAKLQREKRNEQIAAISDDLVQDDAAAASGDDGGGSGGSSLALILALVALACAAAGGGLWYASKRNPAVANALSRVPLPFRNS
jgi:hypothetical protein